MLQLTYLVQLGLPPASEFNPLEPERGGGNPILYCFSAEVIFFDNVLKIKLRK